MEIMLGVVLLVMVILIAVALKFNERIDNLETRGEPEGNNIPNEVLLKYTADMGKPEEIEWQVINGHLCLLWNKKVVLFFDKENFEVGGNNFVAYGRLDNNTNFVHSNFFANKAK